MTLAAPRARPGWAALLIVSLLLLLMPAGPAVAQMTAFKQSLAAAASDHDVVAQFYQARDYKPLWTGPSDANRRRALIAALAQAPEHGLAPARYDLAGLTQRIEAARTPKAQGALEAEMSKLFLRYARDVQTGMLVPRRVDSGIVREVPLRDPLSYLVNFEASNPQAFLRALSPRGGEYTRLMREKKRLEALLAAGGWGPQVSARALAPGDSGPEVAALRNRLIAMGFMSRSASQSYDGALQRAVQEFQLAHGLNSDGVAGAGTLAEINVEPV